MVAMRLLVMAVAVMVWQVWLVQRRGRGGAWGGVSLRKMGVAIVKRLQFLIPNRGA